MTSHASTAPTFDRPKFNLTSSHNWPKVGPTRGPGGARSCSQGRKCLYGHVHTSAKVSLGTIKTTPAISTGPTDRVQSIRELLEKTEPTHIQPALVAGFFMRGRMGGIY